MKTTSKLFSDWSEVTSGERNEIVFEFLHKTYGAYQIRTHYDRTLLKAFSATALMIVLFSVYIFISGHFSSVETKIEIPINDTELRALLEKEKIIIPDEPKIKVTSSPKTNQNTEPIITDDSEKDDRQIIPANPTNTASNGNKKDSLGDDPFFIPTGGGEKILGLPIDTILDFVQERPEFPGGDAELMRYLKNTAHIPEVIKEIGKVSEKVGVVFVVDKDGSVTSASIIQGGSKFTELNKEALRVINKMPKWQPGRQNGNAVKVRMILPIRFEVK